MISMTLQSLPEIVKLGGSEQRGDATVVGDGPASCVVREEAGHELNHSNYCL